MLNALIVALLASGAVGMFVSIFIQLGKLFKPLWFPDESADNWRLGLIVLIAAVLFVLHIAGVTVEIGTIESIAVALSTLGATLMPLLVLFANWIAKQTYTNALRGVKYVGISHSTPVA